MADMELISNQIFVSDVAHDGMISSTIKNILLKRGYTYFIDFIRRDIDSNNNYSMEIITFASLSNPFMTNNFVLNNIDVLNKICDDISQKCHRLLTKENTVILPKEFMINVNEIFTFNMQSPRLDLKTKLLESCDSSIAYCKLGHPQKGYRRDVFDERCFAEWVTICPALNIDIALLMPLKYFEARKATPVCEDMFKRMINKKP